MMAEQHPLVGGHEIAAVIAAFGGSRTRVVERQEFGADERGIQPVGDEIAAHSGDHEPGGIERLAAMQGDGTERGSAKNSYGDPRESLQQILHERVAKVFSGIERTAKS